MTPSVRVDYSALAARLLQRHNFLYEKLQRACEISRETVPDVMIEVLRFLHLSAHSGESLTPSQIVDYAWHEFILCTQAYGEFCQQHFGRMIHHYPGGDGDGFNDRYQRTLSLYIQEFGMPNPRYWPHPTIALDADCGSCFS